MPIAPSRPRAHTPARWTTVASRVSLAIVLAVVMLAPSLALGAGVAAQASTVSFSTAEVAPADAFAYVVSTTDNESAQWQLADDLIDRAGFGEALDEALAEELSDESGEDLPLDAFMGGEVAVVLTQTFVDVIAAESMGGADFGAMMGSMDMATPEPAAEQEGQGFAVVLDARAPDTAWAGIREAAPTEDLEETTYEGTTILFTPPGTADEDGMAAARVGDLILFGSHPVDLYPIIDTADGRTPAITTVPEFTAARDALPDEFLMFAFTNNAGLTEADFGQFAMAAGQLGANSFSGLTVTADAPGFRLESVALSPEGEPLPPSAPNFDSELAGLAPEDTIFFTSASDLGATGVLDAIGATALALAFGMGGASPMPDEDVPTEDFIAEQYEAAASLIGINLQTEFFQQFSGEYGAWISAGADGADVNGLFATGATDPEAVANTLMQLSFLIQGASGAESPLTTREIDGGQIYVIDLGDDAGSTFEFGVVGDRLVIGSGAAVDRLEGEPETSLANNERFQSVLGTLPAQRNGMLYIDLERAIPLIETAAEETEDLGFGGFEEFPDASESCADYTSQEEAQAAYDAAESGTFDLDQDFDGEVCEDFFVSDDSSAPAADDPMVGDDPADIFADVDYSAMQAYAQTSYEEDGLRRTSAILYIAE